MYAIRSYYVQRYEDEDRLVWNVQLTEGAVTLNELQVTARRGAVQIPERPTPGSTERLLTPDLVSRLPIETADVNLLATLVPGVITSYSIHYTKLYETYSLSSCSTSPTLFALAPE